jgi:uncharacterized protein YbcC (UPF0753/DUF2309 family)
MNVLKTILNNNDPVSGFLAAARQAALLIPPAFPLSATVAVNPFMGHAGDDLATASARLGRVAGAQLTRPRSEYALAIESGSIVDSDLLSALAASDSPMKPTSVGALKASLTSDGPRPEPLQTVAELAAKLDHVDWPAIISRTFGLWASGHFDRGQALWTPAPGRSAFAAWREWAIHDLTPEIAGLRGFCAHVFEAPDNAERSIVRAAERLGISETAAPSVFHRLLTDLGGWAQHARWLSWQAELAGNTDQTLIDLLAVRLVWEEVLFLYADSVAPIWAATLHEHEAPLEPGQDEVIDAILQEAAERSHQRSIASSFGLPQAASARPELQAAFCIDVRSEVFRRALEGVDSGIETLGFAGFFGLPVQHRPFTSVETENHLPVLLSPSLASSTKGLPGVEDSARVEARATRAWGRFRQAAVSSFAFVESTGWMYGWKLLRDSLSLASPKIAPATTPRFDPPVSPAAKAATAAAVLRAMSLTSGHARLVLLVGHGAHVANNPHQSAYHCGACGGQTGEVSARLLADLLNDPETRAGLPEHGLSLPHDTIFVAGLHDTTTDHVTLYRDGNLADHAGDLARAERWLQQAGIAARAERALRLPGARPSTIAKRATDWAQIRPEWGLAGCAAFIAAPRTITSHTDLKGRAFLHSYDWKADKDFATLELIITAPVVVASWISLQYYASSVAPDVFGGGNKLIHNVVGGIGVVEGNGGTLRTGLPWQTVHDGSKLAHEPLRLSVFIEAPHEAIIEVLSRHPEVRALFDNGWLHLFALHNGSVAARYRRGLNWETTASAVSLGVAA